MSAQGFAQGFAQGLISTFRKIIKNKRDYFTFLISLILILVVPLTTFSLFFLSYFGNHYQEKVLSLAEATGHRTQVYFEQTISQCNKIAELLHRQEGFLIKDPGGEPSYWNSLTGQLNEVRILNEAIVEIVYQDKDSSVLFTTNSTIFAPKNTRDVLHRMEFLPEQPGFYRETFIGSGPDSEGHILAYTVPFEDGSMFNFWLDGELLLPAPTEDGRFSLVLMDNDKKIWHSGNLPKGLNLSGYKSLPTTFSILPSENGDYYVNALSTVNIGATVLYLLPYSMIMSESTMISRVFFIVLLLEAIVCIALIFFLAKRSYKPVRELYGSVLKFTPELLPSVPSSELASANYALQQLSSREMSLKRENEEARMQKPLHRLFTGNLRDYNKLTEAGISFEGRYYAVFCLGLAREVSDVMFEPLQKSFLDILSEKGIKAYSVDYIENRSKQFLLTLEKEQNCIELLLDPANILCEKFGHIFYIGCGCVVEDWREIWRSAYQASATPRDGEKILYNFSDVKEDKNFYAVYPQTELDGLYHAIISKNHERVRFLTDLLLRNIDSCKSRFLSSNLSNAAVVVLLRGAGELGIKDTALEQISFRTSDDEKKYIVELCHTILSQIKKSVEITDPHEENGIEHVLQYIKENIDNPNLGVAMIGEKMGISPAALGRLFHDNAGKTISEYIGSVRHEHIKMLLISTDQPVSEIAQQMGYSQTSSFIRRFKSMEGITPGEYRQKQ